MERKTYNVVAQRSPGGPYLLTEEDPETMDSETVEVVQYNPFSKIAWKPWRLQMYLARGYWYDSDVDTVDAEIEQWMEPGKPSTTPTPGRLRPPPMTS